MLAYLPELIREEIETLGGMQRVGEVHLRANRVSTVTVGGENIALRATVTGTVLEEILHAVCGGSIYAYRDSIRMGYIALSGGVRMGLAGRCVTEGEDVVAVTDLTTLCFRIPHHIPQVADAVYREWMLDGGREGILVVAPPACGKTTFLRDFITQASAGTYARRVAVVDSREELCSGSGGMVDVLLGYPRARGLEIALRTLSPEVLVSDEIGAEEVCGVREVLYGGVPLVASMHGASLTQLRHRPYVNALLETGVFRYVVTLTGARGGWQSAVERLP